MTFQYLEVMTRTELEWLFNYSDADCNLKSNWSSMVAVACFGASTTFIDPYNSFILNSSRHRQDVLRIFSLLSDLEQNILFASFMDHEFDPQVEKIFNKYTGTVYCLHPAKDLSSLCRRILNGGASMNDKLILSQLRQNAQTRYHKAIIAYQNLKRQMENE